MVETLPTVYANPPSTESIAVEKGFDLAKSVLTNDLFSMVGAVATCEILQNIMLREYVPGHMEHVISPDGHAYWRYIPEQPRQMLLSQPLSTTLETAIVASTILKSVSTDVGGLSGVLNIIKLWRGL